MSAAARPLSLTGARHKEATFSPQREFTLQGGSLDNRRVTGDLGQPLGGKAAFRVNGVYENSGSPRRFVDRECYGVNPTVTLAPSERTRVNFGHEYFHDGRTADRGIPSYRGRPADISISTFFGDPANSRVRADVNLLSGAVAHGLAQRRVMQPQLRQDLARPEPEVADHVVALRRRRVIARGRSRLGTALRDGEAGQRQQANERQDACETDRLLHLIPLTG